ncbi:MAG: helix-hairpin-helix domain-containing protein, partial [Nitrospirota bacterium]
MAEILNVEIAQRLREVAALLQEQGANPFRVQAYRHAADTVQRLDRPAAEIVRAEGPEGLRKLPGIGESLARSIRDLIATGRLPMLDRLRGETDHVAVLASVPGIGGMLAKRLHHDLSIDTLEELESAAHDGRLSEIEGIGPKKLAGIIDSLASRLGRVRGLAGAAAAHGPSHEPSVAELLDVDREYRENAAAGSLRTIAPRRFNPDGEAWLPVLHTHRGPRHYTALFSNTACLPGGSTTGCVPDASATQGRFPYYAKTDFANATMTDWVGLPNWFLVNRWDRVIYYAVAPGYVLNAASQACPGNCLTVDADSVVRRL